MEQRSVWVGAQYGCGCMHGFVGWMDGVSERGADVCVDRCGSLGVGVQAKIAKRELELCAMACLASYGLGHRE